jgi:mRNA-degrading endonuclease RelE of RelBE toxin-antitoxin system
MKVEFLKQFSKDLDDLVGASIKRQVADLIEQVEFLDSLPKTANIKKLKGHRNAYRVRLGDYRIGFFLEGNTVTFARLLHRKDVYRQFP